MDYTKQSLAFRLKKTLRYIQLYGIWRTLIKVKGQYHMKKEYSTLPALPSLPVCKGNVGIIGCGNFAFSNIAYYLKKNYGRVIRGAMDINPHRCASLFEHYGLCYYTSVPEEIIADPKIDLIYIASNHASHAEYGVMALEAGKNIHIEKPHVIDMNQLRSLCSSMLDYPGKVSLGFNRPKSRIFKEMKKALDSQSGPLMMNWFIAGHEIAPDHWYFKKEEGGRVLGNLCHWTDFLYQLVPAERRYPITITPTRDEKHDCDIAVTYLFGEGSIGIITFSAKGHTFEGVRERFAAHRGNILIYMDDFKKLIIENVDMKRVISPFFRNHGHKEAICGSYEMIQSKTDKGCTIPYVWETGELFIRTKEALEQNKPITIHGYNAEKLKDLQQ